MINQEIIPITTIVRAAVHHLEDLLTAFMGQLHEALLFMQC